MGETVSEARAAAGTDARRQGTPFVKADDVLSEVERSGAGTAGRVHRGLQRALAERGALAVVDAVQAAAQIAAAATRRRRAGEHWTGPTGNARQIVR